MPLGGVGRRALAGTEQPEANIAASDQPVAVGPKIKPEQLMAPAVNVAQSAMKAGKVKSIKLKVKLRK
jgi:hypothetical protein